MTMQIPVPKPQHSVPRIDCRVLSAQVGIDYCLSKCRFICRQNGLCQPFATRLLSVEKHTMASILETVKLTPAAESALISLNAPPTVPVNAPTQNTRQQTERPPETETYLATEHRYEYKEREDKTEVFVNPRYRISPRKSVPVNPPTIVSNPKPREAMTPQTPTPRLARSIANHPRLAASLAAANAARAISLAAKRKEFEALSPAEQIRVKAEAKIERRNRKLRRQGLEPVVEAVSAPITSVTVTTAGPPATIKMPAPQPSEVKVTAPLADILVMIETVKGSGNFIKASMSMTEFGEAIFSGRGVITATEWRSW